MTIIYLFESFVWSGNRAFLLSYRSVSNLEIVKLEKKRERNRIAATKCRQRKMEKIQTLGKMRVKLSIAAPD